MDIKKERQVEPLKDIDEKTYFDAIKNGTIEQYENEIALSEGALSIPKEILELPIKAQYVLAFYNDKEFINKETGKNTYQNVVESYIAASEDSSVVKKAFKKNEDGVMVPDPENKHIYMKVKQHALSFWNNNNLSQIVDIFKKLMYGGRRQEELLKDAIIDDALFNDDVDIRLKSRNQAIKILGMDKNVQSIGQDVWLKGGGKEFGKHLSQYLNNDGYDLSNYIEAEISEVSSDE